MVGMTNEVGIRLARPDELDALRALVARSFRGLGVAHYGHDVVEAAVGTIIRVDPELVHAGSYFVAERGGTPVGCGGWSDRVPTVAGLPLPVPRAEVRAMFVVPEQAGQGIGRALLAAAEDAIAGAGFAVAHLVATRSGLDFYLRAGYRTLADHTVALASGHGFGLTCMERRLVQSPQDVAPVPGR
jgi:GNAT superfamily N-acetyltransferase